MKDIINIYQAISNAMAEVDAIGKDNTNKMQGYKYRGIDDMYNVLNPLLSKHKIFATSEVIDNKRETQQSKNGGVLFYTILTVKFTFYTVDGSNVSSIMVGEAMDSGDKSSNKAMSTAYKYALMQLLLIPTEEVKDTEESSCEVMPKTAPKAPASPVVPQKVATQAVSFQGLLAEAGKLETQMRVELFKKKVNDLVKNKEIKMTVDQSNELKQAIADVSESFQPTSDEMSQEEANSFVDSL